MYVRRWPGIGKGITLHGLSADLIGSKNPYSGTGGAFATPAAPAKPVYLIKSPASRFFGSNPKTLLDAVKNLRATVSNPNPNVTDSMPFRKGSYLRPNTIMVDAWSGEGPYNPSSQMDTMQFQVKQAADRLKAQAANTPSVAPIIAPQTYDPGTGNGGGGGGGAASTDTGDQQPVGFWAGLSTPGKVGLVAAGLGVVGLGVYFLFFRKRGGGAGPRHKS